MLDCLRISPILQCMGGVVSCEEKQKIDIKNYCLDKNYLT